MAPDAPVPPSAPEWAAAKDAITALITLSSAVLTISLTFSKNWVADANGHQKAMLQTSWILMLLSTVCGVASLLTLAGIAYKGLRIRQPLLRSFWIAQILSFLLGLGVLVWFAWGVLNVEAPPVP